MMTEVRKEKFIKDLKNKLNQKAYGNITEETVLIKAFKYFDLDNTGKSDENCFLKTINKIGVTSFDDEEILQIFHLYDPENTGEIDYKEFASELFLNKSLSKKNKKSESEQNKQNEIPLKNIKEEEQPIFKEIQGASTKKEYLNENSVEGILKIIREKLSKRGVQGICSIARNFRIVDENNTQTIDFNEFKKACKIFNFGLDDNQMRIAFVAFDRDNTGEIDYDEFVRSIRGEMNEFRQKIVQKAFEILDINKNGEVSFDEIKNKYNARNHPDVLSGKKTEDEILKEFMDTFQETYNYLCGTETDNIITIEEFLEYYENVSMIIDDDNYFELLLNNTWKMGLNTTYNNDKKSWNQNDDNAENLKENYKKKFGDKKPGYKEEEVEREKNEIVLVKFINEIRNLGSTCLISLLRQFKLNDENNTKELEIYEFIKALHEFETELNDDEINSVFNYFDKEKTGVINYVNFINAIRGPMSPKRVAVVKEAFKKIDIDKSGQIEIAEIKLQYNAKNDKDVKSGKKTEEDVYTEFVETFQMNHDNRVGPRNKRVTFDEFLDYYNFVSMGIEDDSYFITKVQNEWKINPYYSKVNNPQIEENIEKDKDNIKNQKKRFGAAAAPFGTDMTPLTEDYKKQYFYPDIPNDKKKEISPVEKFRNTIQKRGVRGVMSMRRAFMIADENDSKTLNLPEFIKFCHDYRIPIEGKDINVLFQEFDKDKSGEINYEEFVYAFIGEMNERRKRLIKILFDSFDKNKSGFVDLDEIRNSYSPSNHPDVLSGKKTEDEVLAEFLDSLQYHFSLLKSKKEDNNKITFEDFLEYFNNVSVGIENDDYFENMIKNGFNLEERRPKKKGWKSII